jgi:hypothetical protein
MPNSRDSAGCTATRSSIRRDFSTGRCASINWTRTGGELIGSVFLYVDHTAPVEAIRKKLVEIVGQSKLWNGKVASLQVSDCKETTIELRALISADNASSLWDLRCEVREKLIDFLQREYPTALPRRRYEAAESVLAKADG